MPFSGRQTRDDTAFRNGIQIRLGTGTERVVIIAVADVHVEAFVKEDVNSLWVGDRLIPLSNACIHSFGAHGFGFNLYTYNPVQNVPRFVTVRDADAIVPRERIFIAHGTVETFSDLFAYNLLATSGGWWVDNDVLCNTERAPQVDIAFAEEKVGIINNAVLKFPAKHPAVRALLDYISTVDPVTAPWGATGPAATTKVFNEQGLGPYKLPMAEIYPLHWTEAPKLLFPEFTREVTDKIAAAPFVHLWGATLREIGFNDLRPLEGSYMDRVYSKYLDPDIAKTLRPTDESSYRRDVQQHIEREWQMPFPL